MQTIKRLYLYLITLIVVESTIWGTISLLRYIFARSAGDEAAALSISLATIFVAVPVFLLHWWLIQREIQRNPEERFTRLRALFSYTLMGMTLMPVVLGVADILKQLVLRYHLPAVEYQAYSLVNTMILIAVNLGAFSYFLSLTQHDWQTQGISTEFHETRRLYRYFWLMVGQGMLIYSIHELLSLLVEKLTRPQPIVYFGDGSTFIELTNPLSLLIIAVPIWWISLWTMSDEKNQYPVLKIVGVYALQLAGMVLADWGAMALLHPVAGEAYFAWFFVLGAALLVGLALPTYLLRAHLDGLIKPVVLSEQESQSLIRMILLYLLIFIGLLVILGTAVGTVYELLSMLFAETLVLLTFLTKVEEPLTILITCLPFWFFYRHLLQESIEQYPFDVQRQKLDYLYRYVLALVGLIGMFTSLQFLSYYLVTFLSRPADFVWMYQREGIALSLAFFVVAAPIWYHNWNQMQLAVYAQQQDQTLPRHNIFRKVYLYFVVFVGVVGVISGGIALFFILLMQVFESQDVATFVTHLCQAASVLALFALFLWYHIRTLIEDGSTAKRNLMARFASFKILVIPTDSIDAPALTAAIQREIQGCAIQVTQVEAVEDAAITGASIIVLPTRLMHRYPELFIRIQQATQDKIILPEQGDGLYFPVEMDRAALYKKVARMLRSKAMGDQPIVHSSGAGPIIVWAAVILLAPPVLGTLISLLGMATYRF